jgi:hypothetical protein
VTFTSSRRRTAAPRLALVGLIVLLGALVGASQAGAAVSISRAELNNTRLRVEGTATPNRTITVDGVAMGTSDGNGSFRIEADPFRPPSDCTVAIGDGSSTTTATLSGCSVSSPPPPPPPLPPPPPPPAPPPPPPPAQVPALASVRIAPTDVVGGTPATGTVTLTSAAPAGGVAVPLTSDDPAAATVPATVTVPAGSTTASFPVMTNVVPNPQSSLIIGTAGGVTTYGIITVWTPFLFANGSIGIVPGGNGNGRITSQPAGIDCVLSNGSGSGTCSAFFPVGTVVRLDARPAADSSFRGWRPTPGCADASRVTASRGAFISCQPVFVLR